MRRPITLTILGSVLLALLVSGVGTLGLARYSARHRTEQDLRHQTTTLAEAAETLRDAAADSPRGSGGISVLNGIRQALELTGLGTFRIGPRGRVADALPDGIQESDLDLDRLRAGETLSGRHGRLVWSASPATNGQVPGAVVVLVATRTVNSEGPAFGWLVLSSIAALGLAAVAATWLSGSLSAPLRTAEQVTGRIATGDLSARLPDPAPGDSDEGARLARSVNTMAEALERSRGLERQFLLSISHDLRTPLTSIRGYAEALADGALDDPAAGGLVIQAEARRLERLVQDLLDLARLESHRFTFDLQRVDLVDVAAGTVDGFRPEADDAGVVLTALAPGGPVQVVADPDRLAQVTANLVENALKHAGTRVTLEVTGGGGWARLDVVDDGPGIAPDDLPHVFERLYVSRHRPQRKEAGSGLGLAIVRELVTAMGGRVAAATDPGGGARLSVLLPAAPG